jgi:myo-inositol-1-phosphate synthase
VLTSRFKVAHATLIRRKVIALTQITDGSALQRKVIRVAIAGVGSCCSSFLQTLTAARSYPNTLTGISHSVIADFSVADIELVAAFDVDERKVGRDLSEAAGDPSNAALLHVPIPPLDLIVDAGPVLDGVNGPLGEVIPVCPESKLCTWELVANRISYCKCDVVLCCLPTGANDAVRAYAMAAAHAGAAFVNCTPSPAARDSYTVQMFQDRGLPLLGDDLRSHVGATTLHGMILELLATRGIEIVETHQINIGGNADFLNLSDRNRSKTKVESKRRALLAAGNIEGPFWAGPNGYMPGLGDRKICHISVDARSLLGSPIRIDVKLEVEDSPNAAAVMINAVRAAYLARERGISGVVEDASSFLFKSPPNPVSPSIAEHRFRVFIEK